VYDEASWRASKQVQAMCVMKQAGVQAHWFKLRIRESKRDKKAQHTGSGCMCEKAP